MAIKKRGAGPIGKKESAETKKLGNKWKIKFG